MKRKHKKKRGHKMIIAILIIGIILLGALLAIWVRSSLVDRHSENTVFLQGVSPDPALNGRYKGTTSVKTDWQGKRLDAAQNSGINVFPNGERYQFKTSTEKSLSSNNQVLKLDYNRPGNPWWLRPIVDEVSQTKPGEYQGKVYVKLGALHWTILYFGLSAE